MPVTNRQVPRNSNTRATLSNKMCALSERGHTRAVNNRRTDLVVPRNGRTPPVRLWCTSDMYLIVVGLLCLPEYILHAHVAADAAACCCCLRGRRGEGSRRRPANIPGR